MVERYLLCAFVCMALCVMPNTKQLRDARQLCIVANIKQRFVSNGGHSVRFLNRFGIFIGSSNRMSEMFPYLMFSR